MTAVSYAATDMAGKQEAIKRQTIVIGYGFACAGPQSTFTLPPHGMLVLSGSAAINGTTIPFNTNISF